MLLNPINGPLLQHRAQKMCVKLRYGLYLTENDRFNVDIEDKKVCVGQVSLEIKTDNADYVLNGVSVASIYSNQWSFPSSFHISGVLICDVVFL